MEDIKLINEDSLQAIKAMADDSYDWAIVDPPYGIDRDVWDNRPPKEYWDELFRVSKNQIVYGGNYFELPVTENWLCWDKTNNGKSFFKHKAKFELLWLSVKTKPDFIRYTLDGNVEGWDKPKPNYNKIKAIHSCQKPVPVYEYLLDRYTEENDLILDTHLGSGSIAIACHYMKRKLTAYEIDPKYYESACKRFNEQTSQQALW